MLTIFDDVFSPYARKVRIALYEKDIPFERVRALHGDCNRTDFVDVNPRAEVPALLDGDFALYDSTVICEYIEDRYPAPPLYPHDAQTRAKCRLIEDLADTQLDAATYAVAIIELGRSEVHEAMHVAAGRDMQRLYDELERHLGTAPFFCEAYSLADIAVVPHVMAATFLGFGLDPARHPGLARWLDRVQERPALLRDNADVLATLQRLQEEKRPAFDPYRVQWRSDRLEWVIKNGFAAWFIEEMKAGRVFFPLSVSPESAAPR
ncbi:MAG: glutathione S-transferase family protein [Deltaproteobacteria bacterium]|nr:glutathione S-transferase family protein [Deltaproteobacteria bacterium]MBI3389931.1 glutathione S-transferase family protein [Deltaproteobacteria bacterium]